MSDAAFSLALKLERLGEIPSAMRTYAIILANVDDARAAVNLGTIHFHRKEYGIAASYYRRAIEIAPDYALAFYNLGNVLDELNSTKNAVEAYQQAIRIDPNHADSHYNLALSLSQFDPRRALKHWKAYVRLDPSGPYADHARREIRRTVTNDKLSIVWRRYDFQQ